MARRTNTNTFETREAFENAIHQITDHQLSIASLEAERDTQKDCVLNKYNTQIKCREAEIKTLQTAAMAYASEHWAELAPSPTARSADTARARCGFRTGQPTVQPKEGTVTDAAQHLYDAGWVEYVETKVSLNKPAILKALQEKVKVIADLFKTKQTERFYVEAKAAKD